MLNVGNLAQKSLKGNCRTGSRRSLQFGHSSAKLHIFQYPAKTGFCSVLGAFRVDRLISPPPNFFGISDIDRRDRLVTLVAKDWHDSVAPQRSRGRSVQGSSPAEFDILRRSIE
jgi:hypothetical protein